MNNQDEIKKYRDYKNTRLLLTFTGVISILISITFLSIPGYVSDLFLISNRFVIISGVVLFIVSLWVLFRTFLSQSFRFYQNYDEMEDFDLNSIFSYHLKKNFIDKYGAQYRRFDKPEVEEILFENELESFKQKYILQAIHDLEFAHLFEELNKLENKFKTQIERLISNSNLNLIIGITTTLLAIIILGSSIFQQKHFSDYTEFLAFFIPRISTVIFVEIFSFFFLNLYKNNLNEIKYFQNEITNLSFKITSLKTAIKTDDKQTLSQIITNFSQTERNFILKKDETTEKIESNKIENSQISNFSKSLSELLNAVKK